LREGVIHTEIVRQNRKIDGNQSFQLSIERRNNSHRERSSKRKKDGNQSFQLYVERRSNSHRDRSSKCKKFTEIKVSSYPLREGIIHTEIVLENEKTDTFPAIHHTEIVLENEKTDGNQSFQLSIEKRNNSQRDRSSKWKKRKKFPAINWEKTPPCLRMEVKDADLLWADDGPDGLNAGPVVRLLVLAVLNKLPRQDVLLAGFHIRIYY
jgi:hypothetical protein